MGWDGKGWSCSKMGAKRYSTYAKAQMGLKAAKKKTSASPSLVLFNVMEDEL